MDIHCDNQATVYAMTNFRAKDKVLNAIARAFWFKAAASNIEFRFTHIPGQEMCVADTLSRAYIDKAHQLRADDMVSEIGFSLIDVSPRHHDFNRYL